MANTFNIQDTPASVMAAQISDANDIGRAMLTDLVAAQSEGGIAFIYITQAGAVAQTETGSTGPAAIDTDTLTELNFTNGIFTNANA